MIERVKKGVASHPNYAAFLFYSAICLFFTAPFLFFNQSLYIGDITYNFEPAARFAQAGWLATGRVPCWNPYILCGASITQYCWPLAYIGSLPFLLASFHKATGCFLFMHLLLAGFSCYLWLKNKTANPLQSFLSGFIFMCSGFMAGSTISIFIIAQAAWIPALLACLDQIIEKPRMWCVGMLAAFFGFSAAAGRPELFACCLLLYALYFLWQCTGRQSGFGIIATALNRAVFIGIAGIIALPLSALNLLPLLEAVYEAPPIRHLDVLHPFNWSAGYFDISKILLMEPFGHIGATTAALNLSYPGQIPYITSLYLGPPVIMLALIGFLSPSWKERWFWLVIALSALVLSGGEFAYLLPALNKMWSQLSLIRFPIKLCLFFIFPLSIAAGYGWQRLIDNQMATVMKAGLAVWSSVFVLGLLLLFTPDSISNTLYHSLTGARFALTADQLNGIKHFPRELMLAGLAGFIPCYLAYRRQKHWQATWLAAIFLLLTVNFTAQFWNTVDADFFSVESPLATFLKSKEKDDFFRVVTAYTDRSIKAGSYGRLDQRQADRLSMLIIRQALVANANMDQKIRLINGEAIVQPWAGFFLNAGLVSRSNLAAGSSIKKNDLPLYRWCQITGARYLISQASYTDDRTGASVRTGILDPDYFVPVEMKRKGGLVVYRTKKTLPRFELRKSVKVIPGRIDAFKYIQNSPINGFDPETTVIITPRSRSAAEELSSFASSGRQPADGRDEKVELLSEDDWSVSFDVQTDSPAFFVLRDSFYYGWTASDNGQPSHIYLADANFRALLLAPGKHQISFRYEPTSMRIGYALGQVGAFIIFTLLLTAVFPRFR